MDTDETGGLDRTGAQPFRPARLLQLCWPLVRASVRRFRARFGPLRAFLILSVGLGAAAVVFTLTVRVLSYFEATPGLGDALALKLLATILLAVIPLLVFWNVVNSLAIFFLARDIELLVSAPVDMVHLYGARLLETMVHSSWLIVLLLTPMLAAFATVHEAGPAFFVIAVVVCPAFFLIPAVIGTIVTQILVHFAPVGRARSALGLVTVLLLGLGAVGFRLLRPERLAEPEGVRGLVDFIAALQLPHSAWLPSEWAAQALLIPIGLVPDGDLFPALLLASTAAVLVVGGAWLHQRLFLTGLDRAREPARLVAASGLLPGIEQWLAWLPELVRSLVARDIRRLVRDSGLWTQLVLICGLAAVYLVNMVVLPVPGGTGAGTFVRDVVSFLNIGLTGFVVAVLAARLVLPAISLEGPALWLLRSAPIDPSPLVWSKFGMGALPLLLLTCALTVGSNLVLGASVVFSAVSVATSVMLCLALAAFALACGTAWPHFNASHSASLPSGSAGLTFMIGATLLIGVVLALEAGPAYAALLTRSDGLAMDLVHYTGLGAAVGCAMLTCALVATFSLRFALNRMRSGLTGEPV